MFYDNYKKLCLAIGKSTTKVGNELGISSGTVSAWKNGRTPTGAMLQKVANYFNVSSDYLLTGEEPEYVAYRTADEDVLIFDAIDALRREDLRRLVLRLSKASDEEIRKVHGFLDLTQIGGSVDG